MTDLSPHALSLHPVPPEILQPPLLDPPPPDRLGRHAPPHVLVSAPGPLQGPPIGKGREAPPLSRLGGHTDNLNRGGPGDENNCEMYGKMKRIFYNLLRRLDAGPLILLLLGDTFLRPGDFPLSPDLDFSDLQPLFSSSESSSSRALDFWPG